MKSRIKICLLTVLGFFAGKTLWLLWSGCSSLRSPRESYISMVRINYHGWTNAIRMTNYSAEVVIVPEIGRIMQFRLVGEDNVFWENEQLQGRTPEWNEAEWRKSDWINFGGDKPWPMPEGDWPKFTRRGWKPPPAFDGMRWKSDIEPQAVVLTSPVDPYYGIRVRRRIELSRLSHLNVTLTVTTTFERISGEPAKIGIWVITQFRDPVGVFIPIPEKTLFTNGYAPMWDKVPPSLKNENGWLSLSRDRKTSYKIGSDAGRVYWVGSNVVCRIDSPRIPGVEYPDMGSSVEVYTNDDPLRYVELETLGPLKLMKRGDKITQRNIYTLYPRNGELSAAEEVRRLQ